jgi:hypothetical protein
VDPRILHHKCGEALINEFVWNMSMSAKPFSRVLVKLSARMGGFWAFETLGPSNVIVNRVIPCYTTTSCLVEHFPVGHSLSHIWYFWEHAPLLASYHMSLANVVTCQCMTVWLVMVMNSVFIKCINCVEHANTACSQYRFFHWIQSINSSICTHLLTSVFFGRRRGSCLIISSQTW